ncbi:MAG: ECF transporter S component [Anaerovoracaceae bacterium]|nr:ECF transporter S component [Anaerovoracaceae bacterium]
MRKQSTRRMVNGGLLLALGMVLPFFTGQIPSIGSRLLPMHIPALLTGYICGPLYGLLIGFVMPIFRSIIFQMPPMYPIAIAMAFELSVYGLVVGLLYKTFPKKPIYLYLSLIIAMVAGRIVWGIASYILFAIGASTFSMEMFIGVGFINAIPGIMIQLIIIPPIILFLRRGKVIND